MNTLERRSRCAGLARLAGLLAGGVLAAIWLVATGCGYDPSQSDGTQTTPTPFVEGPTPAQDSPTPCPDDDGDGVCAAQDCNDQDASVYPGAREVCDQKDNDCDGVRDVDDDGDGYVSAAACLTGDDCDDSNSSIYPGAAEVCNYTDDDCDGRIDDGVEPQTYYRDNDGDGYGSGGLPKESCTQPPNYSPYGNDCNDTDPDVYPGAEEVCNGIDDDCDGINDNGVKLTTYPDADGDGYGDGGQTPRYSCTVTDGYVLDDTDCNDTDPMVNPGTEETCNNIDDDCDGDVDEGLPRTEYYQDTDGDGFGVDTAIANLCTSLDGYVDTDGDCDDTDPDVYPGAEERCNGVDDDCDGTIPENETEDADGDGSLACADCDDTNAEISPSATESCNGLDDDCDGLVDEDFPEGVGDVDGDGVQDCVDDDCPRWVDASAAPGGDGQWSTPYATIQEAIDVFAVDSRCSVVRVQPGVYHEQIDFKTYPLTVEASVPPPRVDVDTYVAGDMQEPEGASVIDAGGNGPAVMLPWGQEAALVGFVIRNGAADTCGGGVLVREGSPRVEQNRIEYSSAAAGGGICVQGSGQPVISDNDVIGNSARDTGGGIHIETGAAPRVTGNAFLDNAAELGGGLYCDAGDTELATLEISNNAFYLNSAGTDGGGVALEGHIIGAVSNNAIASNQAQQGGGAYVHAPADLLVKISGGFIDENTAYQNGGGLMVTGAGGVTLDATVVALNESPLGAGVYVGGEEASAVLLDQVTLDTNGTNSCNQGAGLFVASGAKATVTSAIVQFNVVKGQGGGIYAAADASLTVEGTYVGGNQALSGAGIFVTQLGALSITAGTNQDTEIAFNEASSYGGGVYLDGVNLDNTDGVVSNARIHDNQAANGAGMVLADSSFKMVSNQIRNNTAVVGEGGGILCQGTTMSIPMSNIVTGNDPAQFEGCE